LQENWVYNFTILKCYITWITQYSFQVLQLENFRVRFGFQKVEKVYTSDNQS